MFCNKCKKEIPNDSIYCIFCSEKVVKDIPIKVQEKRFNKAIPTLAVFFSLFFIATTILAIYLVINITTNQENKKVISELDSSNKNLNLEIQRISNDLKAMNVKYSSLQSDFNNLSVQFEDQKKSNTITNSSESSKNNTNSNSNGENTFLHKVNNTLNEINLAINHMNTYHKPGWIFNNPEEIALENTYLVKLEELLATLKGYSYPNSFSSERNNIVKIMEEICNSKQISINYMNNNDFGDYKASQVTFNSNIKRLFDYYNSLI